ncbi:TetR/AcrR family transcriptional regulator [Niveibacterium sp. SC-1]|uniref:TetR/AcrR family transcriptional regulator n=1 Tax=Niveibacterium sp. SC-1 TaxID=3135646 RepID=UPI00311EE631
METRERIVGAADRLFYEQGYEHTSFAHIAEAVGISRGNFYHHFKTKDEILDAVIATRQERTREMLAAWAAEGDSPGARIRCFIQILIHNLADIRLYGCPVGSLATELTKLGHAARGEANAVFSLFRDWLRDQFREMGCGKASDALAMHLLGRSQGVATLASTFRDDAFVRSEVRQMLAWLDTLAPQPAPRPRRKR